MPALTARDLEARLTGQAEKSGGYVIDAVCFENHQTDARTTPVEVSPTMGASRNGQASNNNPLVVAIDMDKNKLTNADKPVRKGGAGFGVSTKGASYTLTARDQHAVAYAIDSMGSNAMKSKNPHSGCRKIECAPTLTTVDPAPVNRQGGTAVVDFIVRRLTPLECERLQGLPDGYTLIPHRGKPAAECPDTPRYKALGNGWAVNCARWICQRIQKHDMEKQNGTE